MKHAIAMLSAAILAGGLMVTASAPLEAKGNKGSKSTPTSTAKSAKKVRPGYTMKKSGRKPARSAADVLRSRDKAAGTRNYSNYKTTRKTRTKQSTTRKKRSGKPAKAIKNNTNQTGFFAGVRRWFGGLFGSSGTKKATAKKRPPESVASVQVDRLRRTDSGRLTMTR